jgi:hypothetical protein
MYVDDDGATAFEMSSTVGERGGLYTSPPRINPTPLDVSSAPAVMRYRRRLDGVYTYKSRSEDFFSALGRGLQKGWDAREMIIVVCDAREGNSIRFGTLSMYKHASDPKSDTMPKKKKKRKKEPI